MQLREDETLFQQRDSTVLSHFVPDQHPNDCALRTHLESQIWHCSLRTQGSLRKRWSGSLDRVGMATWTEREGLGGCVCSSLARETSRAPSKKLAWLLGLQCVY